MLVILVGKSGTGKTTSMKYLSTNDNTISLATSHTTRKKRVDEVEGEDYYFVDSFLDVVDTDFIERTVYCGNEYGLSRKECSGNHDKIVAMEPKGVDIVSSAVESISIYIKVCPIKRLYRLIHRDGLIKGFHRFINDWFIDWDRDYTYIIDGNGSMQKVNRKILRCIKETNSGIVH